MEFYCDDNNIISIPNISKNLKKITFKNNYIKTVDFTIKEMENLELFDLRQNKDIKIKNIIFAMKISETHKSHKEENSYTSADFVKPFLEYENNSTNEPTYEDDWLLDNIYMDKVYEKPKIKKIEIIEEIYLVIFDLIKNYNDEKEKENENNIIIDYDKILNYITECVETYYLYQEFNDVFIKLSKDMKDNEEIRILFNKLMKIDINVYCSYNDIYNHFKKLLQSQGLSFNIKRLKNQENIKLNINVNDDESNDYYANILDLTANEVFKGNNYDAVYNTVYAIISYDFDENFKVKEIYDEAILLLEKKILNEKSFSEIVNKYMETDKSGFLSYFGKSLGTSLYTGIISNKKYLDILGELSNILDDDIERKLNIKEMYKLLKKPDYIYDTLTDVKKIDGDIKKHEQDHILNNNSLKKTKDRNKIIFKKIIKI